MLTPANVLTKKVRASFLAAGQGSTVTMVWDLVMIEV
jgi:hypothetical protein